MRKFVEGGPVHSSRRVLWTPRWEVTFDPDVTDQEIQDFIARFNEGRRAEDEPIPEFAECGRLGCDLRAKRLEHGHFGHPKYFRPPRRSLWQRLTRWFR